MLKNFLDFSQPRKMNVDAQVINRFGQPTVKPDQVFASSGLG